LKVHGCNYSTEILKECITKEEIKYWGLYYSELWDIVESNEWANLKLEKGDGGFDQHTEKTKKKLSEIAAKRTPEYYINAAKPKKGRKHSDEHRAKNSAANKGRIQTLEHRAKNSAATKGKTFIERYGEEHAKEILAKRSKSTIGRKDSDETRLKKSLAKKGKSYIDIYGEIDAKNQIEKRKLSQIGKKKPNRKPYSKVTQLICPHCGLIGTNRGMTRYHFDNCKCHPSIVNCN
jgi:hypothetical protein